MVYELDLNGSKKTQYLWKWGSKREKGEKHMEEGIRNSSKTKEAIFREVSNTVWL